MAALTAAPVRPTPARRLSSDSDRLIAARRGATATLCPQAGYCSAETIRRPARQLGSEHVPAAVPPSPSALPGSWCQVPLRHRAAELQRGSSASRQAAAGQPAAPPIIRNRFGVDKCDLAAIKVELGRPCEVWPLNRRTGGLPAAAAAAAELADSRWGAVSPTAAVGVRGALQDSVTLTAHGAGARAAGMTRPNR